ncbi:MAG TPA: cupin domain-containing protein [Candidatus Acidoferrales bacterium]|nr:cupin domain-containing protein [Candidatus Acidoferrales bacterium]
MNRARGAACSLPTLAGIAYDNGVIALNREGKMPQESLPANFRVNDDVKYGMLRLVDIPAEAAANAPWFNQTLTTVNESVVRLGIFEGEFPWHKHVDQDEFFLVLEGEIFLDVEGRETVKLGPHEGLTVPKGTVHRPRSPQRSVVLMVESAGIVPTGDFTEQAGMS